MKTNLRLLVVVGVLIGVAPLWSVAPQAMSDLQYYSDEFETFILDPKWTFDNPAPNPEGQTWSLETNPGFLTMTTTGPTDLIDETNTAPKMLQASPLGDFSITARVLADPDVSFEHAGIIVFSSTSSWVRLIRDARANSVYLQTGPNAYGSYVPFPGSDVVLKLTKTGTTYEGQYSTDGGFTFLPIGSVQGPLDPESIGTTVVSTPVDNVFTGQFDYFRVSADPPECFVSSGDLPNNEVTITGEATGLLTDLSLLLHIYASEGDCEIDNPEFSETLDNQIWDPPVYREYEETFVRAIPPGKWYNVELSVSSPAIETCERSTPCATWSGTGPIRSVSTTSTLGIALLILLLVVAGVVLLRRQRLA